MTDEKTRKREIAGLQEAMREYHLSEGTIITMDEKETIRMDEGTVHVVPA